jgi:hypothetical protein
MSAEIFLDLLKHRNVMDYNALIIKIVILGIAIHIMTLISVLCQVVLIKPLSFRALIVMEKFVLLIKIVHLECVIRYAQINYHQLVIAKFKSYKTILLVQII